MTPALMIVAALLGWLVGVLWRVAARPSSAWLVVAALALGIVIGLSSAVDLAELARDAARYATARVILGGR